MVQGEGLPICYTWAEWLQTTALDALDYTDSLPLQSIAAARQTATVSPPKAATSPGQTLADAGVPLNPGVGPWEKLLVQLLQADAARDFQLFQEVRFSRMYKPLVSR